MLYLVAQFLLFEVLANFTSVTKVWHAGKNNNKTLRHLIDLATYVSTVDCDHVFEIM